jgi:hypothetical protein
VSNPEREARLKDHKYWLETITTEALDKLNDHESTFIEDMERKLNSNFNTLTNNQREYLFKIYERVTK